MTGEEYYSLIVDGICNAGMTFDVYEKLERKLPDILARVDEFFSSVDLSEYEFGELEVIPFVTSPSETANVSVDVWFSDSHSASFTPTGVDLWLVDELDTYRFVFDMNHELICELDIDTEEPQSYHPKEEFLRKFFTGAMVCWI